jgi:hypothetical protein
VIISRSHEGGCLAENHRRVEVGIPIIERVKG